MLLLSTDSITVNGFCVGICSAQVPVYISEIAPPSQRGRLVGAQQVSYSHWRRNEKRKKEERLKRKKKEKKTILFLPHHCAKGWTDSIVSGVSPGAL